MQTLLLSTTDIESLVTMDAAVAAIEAAFAAHGRRESSMPPKVYIELEEYAGDFRAMPAYLDGTVGLKWVNCHADNPARYGLPTVRALYILSDPSTADPLAVMDATWLTAVRTGAAAAVASRHLARKSAASIGFIGCGAQARTILAAHRIDRPDLAVMAHDLDLAAASTFADEVGGQVGALDEVCGCDIVCTATPSRQPVVRRDWVRDGTHLNAMGADAHGKQELDPQILKDGSVVVDDWVQAKGSGEINVPLARGELSLDDLYASLGDIVAGIRPGRTDDRQITVFDSTGLAIQDAALAKVVYQAALEEGVGRTIDFFA